MNYTEEQIKQLVKTAEACMYQLDGAIELIDGENLGDGEETQDAMDASADLLVALAPFKEYCEISNRINSFTEYKESLNKEGFKS